MAKQGLVPPLHTWAKELPALKTLVKTSVSREGSVYRLRYHHTDVVVYDADMEDATLNNGGYDTLTTRRRINDALIGTGAGLWRIKGETILKTKTGNYLFDQPLRVNLITGDVCKRGSAGEWRVSAPDKH